MEIQLTRRMGGWASIILCCVVGFSIATGCKDTAQKPQKQSKIIRKKIVIPVELASRIGQPAQKLPADVGEGDAAGSPASGTSAIEIAALDSKQESGTPPSDMKPEAPAVAAQPVEVATDAGKTESPDQKAQSDPNAQPELVIPVQTAPSTPSEATATPDQEGDDAAISAEAQVDADVSDQLASAVAVAPIDPFAPLFRPEPPESEKAAEKPKPDENLPKRRLTPLEKLDLSQLKLVGIVFSENGSKALVEETSGKGYIISTGTYIGIHSGRVTEIQKDRIIVEEKEEDMTGDTKVRTRELKIERPAGDEYYEM